MQRRKKQFAMAGVLIAGMTFGSTTAFAGSLKIDTQHSAVSFQVTHLMFMKVDGKFREFEGTFEFDDDTSTISNINVTIQAATIDTNVEARDKDLRSHRFFDAEKFPTLTFKSSTPHPAKRG